MTCGVCSPEAFRPQQGKRVWGYLTADEMHVATIGSRKLHFMGCEHVFSDAPDAEPDERPGWQLLSEPIYLRDGDRLILSKKEDLSDAADAHIADLTARGVEVFVLRSDYFEGEDRQICEPV
ncbi:MAG: hypothetical protein AAF636_22570 [Pseudomonadota bacterium]